MLQIKPIRNCWTGCWHTGLRVALHRPSRLPKRPGRSARWGWTNRRSRSSYRC